LLVVLSISAHVLVGSFLIAVSLLTVEEIRPPMLRVVFFKAPPPPPALPPAFGTKHEKPPARPVAVRAKKPVPKLILQPTEVKPPEPQREPVAAEEGKQDDDPEGVPEGGSTGGMEGGQLSGVEGGMPGAVSAPKPAEPPHPKLVASFVFDRERIRSPDPHVPEFFLQSHAHQTVKGMYRICVDTDGRISKIDTVKSLSGVDQAIIDQLMSTWLYKPQPVPVCTIRVFEFHIS
jgi:hypothetical protein